MSASLIARLAGIIVFCLAVIAFTLFYGPARRTAVSPPQLHEVNSTEQLTEVLAASRAKGRVLVCFSRYLNGLESRDSQHIKATEEAMNHGIVRSVYHVPPDSAWQEISASLAARENDMRPTADGFIGIFDDGRVYIQPLSRFKPPAEPVVLLIEPRIWTSDELTRIAQTLKSGNISADLVVIIRGTPRDAELFRSSMTRQPT